MFGTMRFYFAACASCEIGPEGIAIVVRIVPNLQLALTNDVSPLRHQDSCEVQWHMAGVCVVGRRMHEIGKMS